MHYNLILKLSHLVQIVDIYDRFIVHYKLIHGIYCRSSRVWYWSHLKWEKLFTSKHELNTKTWLARKKKKKLNIFLVHRRTCLQVWMRFKYLSKLWEYVNKNQWGGKGKLLPCRFLLFPFIFELFLFCFLSRLHTCEYMLVCNINRMFTHIWIIHTYMYHLRNGYVITW